MLQLWDQQSILAVNAIANTVRSTVNIRTEQNKAIQPRKCNTKHAFELRQITRHPTEQLLT